VFRQTERTEAAVARLKAAGIRTSLFIDPTPEAVTQSKKLGADAVELHTGEYANYPDNPAMLTALKFAAREGASAGLAVHAGHGLSVRNVRPVAAIREIEELNIGHSIVSRSVFIGLVAAVREVRKEMDAARTDADI
jgi:pyridoxine 5-phosphate synthase